MHEKIVGYFTIKDLNDSVERGTVDDQQPRPFAGGTKSKRELRHKTTLLRRRAL
jgi:hypothetical protein